MVFKLAATPEDIRYQAMSKYWCKVDVSSTSRMHTVLTHLHKSLTHTHVENVYKHAYAMMTRRECKDC